MFSCFEASTDLKWELVAVAELSFAIFIAIRAGIRVVTGRIIRHRHQFGLQVAVTAAVSVFASIIDLFSGYLVNPLQSASIEVAMSWLVFFISFALLLRFNVTIATNLNRLGLVSSILAGQVIAAFYGTSIDLGWLARR